MYSPAVLTETPERITITHHHSRVLRLMLFLLGLLPLFGVYEMMLRPHWNFAAFTLDNPLAFAFAAVPVLIAAGCISIIFILVGGAIFGPDIICVFDKKRCMLFYSESKRPFKPALNIEYPFASLQSMLNVIEDTFSEGARTWDITLKLPHHKNAHTLYYYTAKTEALALRERLLTPA